MVTLSRRRILVTGAASGIGAALTQMLRDQGDEIVAIDRELAEHIIACDLSDTSAVDTFCGNLDGHLDAIAHVAGLPGTFAPEQIMQVNFCAARRLTKALAHKMQPQSALVAISSITAHRCNINEPDLVALASGPDEAVMAAAKHMDGSEAYAFSKRLLNVWIEDMAAQSRTTGMRANAAAPGPIETPILNDFKQSMGDEKIAKAAELAGRHGTPDEIAAAAGFLLSPAASWVNGVILDCDGGFNTTRRVLARNLKVTHLQKDSA